MYKKDYSALKKSRELDIVRMVYHDADQFLKDQTGENPDFLLYSYSRRYFFGVEVTELYNNEASARLKKIPGYVDHLVKGGDYKHKDDEYKLFVDSFSTLDEHGNEKATFQGVLQYLPSLPDYLLKLAAFIEEKNQKFTHYAPEVKFHNLLIFDAEGYFGAYKIEDLYQALFSDSIQSLLQASGFREVYLIGNMDGKMRYIPLKGYLLYGYAMQFEGFYHKNINLPITPEAYMQRFIAVLSHIGLDKALVHGNGEFLSVSYGDISIKVDFLQAARGFIMLNRDLDYSDGQPARVYSLPLAADTHTSGLFRQHQEQFTFHSNFSFPVEANEENTLHSAQ